MGNKLSRKCTYLRLIAMVRDAPMTSTRDVHTSKAYSVGLKSTKSSSAGITTDREIRNYPTE